MRDWNDMERIWQYVYSKDQLQTFSEEVWQPAPRPRPQWSQLSPVPLLPSWSGLPPSCLHFGSAVGKSLCVCVPAQPGAARQDFPERARSLEGDANR